MENFLGELEEKIMNILWAEETPLNPAEVNKKLNNEYAYTTIMTVMTRLNKKGVLKRKMEGKTYFYSPAKNKNSFFKPRLKKLFESLINNYGEIAVSQFMDTLEERKSKKRKK